METNEKDLQRQKLEEMIKRKQEVETKKRTCVETPNKEAFRYEELIRDQNRKKTTKTKVFNNAFCVEIKEEQERVMNIVKEPSSNKPLTWYEQVLEKERKMRREEMRATQERLKMIDKRTRYADIIREVLSPPTKSQNTGEVMPIIRSSSKKETRLAEITSSRISKFSQISEGQRVLRPRSLSRKELSPPGPLRSPRPRQTSPPLKVNLN